MDVKEFELDRTLVIDRNFIRRVRQQDFPEPRSSTTLESANLQPMQAIELFHSQIESRHLDFMARRLRKQGHSFYTIGSSGHEGNAAIALAFAIEDMVFLHYRSGAFMLHRARMQLGDSLLIDHLRALTASSLDPIASGRHKVFGSLKLNAPPQTSTIASHLPKAFGAAFSIQFANKKISTKLSSRAVILCSFGDASFNHSTAQGAINASAWLTAHHLPLPLVWVCEDNGIGISVPIQRDWITHQMASQQYIEYIDCDGLNFCDVFQKATMAKTIAQKQKRPVFLHMKTVRLLGHAGSDIESQYRSPEAIIQDENDDPLLHTARILINQKVMSHDEILSLYETTRKTIETLSEKVIQEPKLTSKKSIIEPLIPPILPACFPKTTKNLKEGKPCHLAQGINWVLDELMEQYPQILIFGEDVGRKGGVYQVTQGLQKKYGLHRVFDTLLDEQTILGTAIGCAHNGLLPIPEIQFLAYVHNAIDQIRGEAATLSYFSNGQFTNPMVCRIQGLAYQKGFGGHFHNDNSFGFLREIPGVIVVCPSSGRQAARLLRESVRLSVQEQRVVIFLEPIALYFTKDLHHDNDNVYLLPYPEVGDYASYGQVDVIGSGNQIAVITYGNGVYLAQKSAKILYDQYQIDILIIDLNWLSPLPIESLLQAIQPCHSLLIVDECRKTGSVSEELITLLMEHRYPLPKLQRITAEDTFIPLGDAWTYVLPSVNDIVLKCIELAKD